MIKKIPLLFYLIPFFTVLSQTQNDFKSLKKISNNYYNKAISFKKTNTDSAFFYFNKSLKYAIKCKKCDTILLKNYNSLSNYYVKTKQNYIKAIEFSFRLDSLARIVKNRKFIFLASFNLGKHYKKLLDYEKAISYLKSSLAEAKIDNDTILISKSFIEIGSTYMNIEQYDIAEKFILNGVHYLENIKLKKTDSFKYELISSYTYLTELYSKKSNKKKAIYNLKKMISFSKKYNIKMPYYKEWIQGRVYLEFKDYKKSMQHFENLFEISSKNNDTLNLLESSFSIARVAVKDSDYNKAKIYFDKYNSIKIVYNKFTQLNKSELVDGEYGIYENLGISIHKEIGDYKTALKYAEGLSKLFDSINKKEVSKTFAEYGKKFENEKKDKELALKELELSKNKYLKTVFIIVAFVLVLALLLLYLFFKNKRKKIEDDLNKEKEFTKKKAHFLENITHELRTPITLLMGYLNFIKNNKDKPKEVSLYVDYAIENCKNMIRDTNEILTLSSVKENMLMLNLSKQSLNQFITDVFFKYKNQAQLENQELYFKSNIPNDLIIEFDYKKLEKILNNLVYNAIKYGAIDSKIILSSSIKSNWFIICVQDFGAGIKEADLDKIFSRFYQSANNRTIGGLGIGLSLVKELVTFLKGSISVESKLKEGSKFTIKLPINIGMETVDEFKTIKFIPEIINKNKKDELKSTTLPKILIVEDHREMGNYLDKILNPNFNCTLVNNGEAAIKKLKTKKYDLIISDLKMPIMDGLELKNELNKIEKFKNMPFILLTANTFSETKIKGFTIGINDYITKPFNENELIARIKNLLQNKLLQNRAIKTFDENDIVIDDSRNFNVKFLEKATKIVEDNIDNDSFKVNDLAFECGYSKRQLVRIINKLTGMSPVKFILELRLLKAYELIINNTYPTQKEIMQSIGINSIPYFNKRFLERFGIKPGELYANNNPKNED